MPYESSLGRNNIKGGMFSMWVSADRREKNSHGKWGVSEFENSWMQKYRTWAPWEV